MRTSSQIPTISQSLPRHELCRRQHSSTRSNYSAELSTDPSYARLQVRQQCRTPSTRHVVATHPFPQFNNVELHRPTARTSISTQLRRFARLHVNNIELHRQPTFCMPSPAMSNSIDSRNIHRQQCRTPSAIQAHPSCVQS